MCVCVHECVPFPTNESHSSCVNTVVVLITCIATYTYLVNLMSYDACACDGSVLTHRHVISNFLMGSQNCKYDDTR